MFPHALLFLCLLTAVFCLLISAPQAQAQCDVPGTNGLVGHWKLDETSGNAADSAGSNTGIVNGNPVWNPSGGQIGGMLAFDGTGDYVDTNASLDDIASGDTVTIAAWMRPTGAAPSNTNVWQLDPVVADGPEQFGITRGNDTDSGGDRIWAWNDDGGGEDQIGATYTVDEWAHIVMVHGDGNLSLYKDGQFVASTPSGTTVTTSNNILFGNAADSNYYAGDLDDVRIYDRALTADEIAALYKQRSNAVPIAGEMAFNESTAALQYCDGTDWRMMGTGSYRPEAVAFDGANDWLDRGGDLTGVTTATKVTGSFWYRNDGNNQLILSGNGSPSEFLIQELASERIQITGRNGSDTTVYRVRSSIYADSNWRHVMFSADLDTAGANHLYIDGADDMTEVTFTQGETIDMDFEFNNMGVGASAGGANKFVGDLADLWLDFDTYIDLSIESNRRKFISDKGLPMYLGEDGSLPTGKAPDIFLTGKTADWHTNKGSGGGFTENGEITFSSSRPGTCAPDSGPLVAEDTYDTANFAYDVWTDGAYIFVADNNNGLQVYSFDGSTISHIHTAAVGKTLAVWGYGGYIYAARHNNGLSAYTFDGATLTEIDNWPAISAVLDVWADGNYVYVADSNSGIGALTFDGVSFASAGGYDTDGANSVFGDADYIYLADGLNGGLKAFSFDGSNFTLLDTDTTGGNISYGVTSDGTYIYAARGVNNISAYSFDGANLTHLDTDTVHDGDYVWSDGTYIYMGVSDPTEGIAAFSFDGSALTEESFLATSAGNNGQGVHGDGTYVYLAHGGTGFSAYSGFSTCNCGAGPSGLTPAGVVKYSADFNVMKYCNGSEWVAMGPVGGTPPVSGLQTHYKLDEITFTSAADSSGNGNNGSLINGLDPANDSVTGMVGSAFKFDGIDDKIITSNGNSVKGQGQASISLWFKPERLDGTVQRLYYECIAADCTLRLTLTIQSDNKLQWTSRAPDGDSAATLVDDNRPLQTGVWHHVVAVVDTVTDVHHIYLNGEDLSNSAAEVAFDNTNPIYPPSIGAISDAASLAPYRGNIDDFRFYNRVLTPQEVQQLYHYGLSAGLGDVSAACTQPAMIEGALFYNASESVMQYCNGEEWIGIGK